METRIFLNKEFCFIAHILSVKLQTLIHKTQKFNLEKFLNWKLILIENFKVNVKNIEFLKE